MVPCLTWSSASMTNVGNVGGSNGTETAYDQRGAAVTTHTG
jgi:hypothetical protein